MIILLSCTDLKKGTSRRYFVLMAAEIADLLCLLLEKEKTLILSFEKSAQFGWGLKLNLYKTQNYKS